MASLGTDRHQVIAHLQVLRAAGLVVVEKRGRVRLNHLNPVPIQAIYTRWVSAYAQPWADALVGLKHEAERLSDGVHSERQGGRVG